MHRDDYLLVAYVGNYLRNQQTDGFVQDCSNSIANRPELLQSCTEPSKKDL